MRVLVAMSGGVDSSVAAALLAERLGPDRVVGATLKLWGGASDSGCCSVADVEDARRVADQLGLVHHVFNFADEFEAQVVEPYVEGHAEGRTPNPCIECNRHLKFDRLLERARTLGFDAVATGHHARCTASASRAVPSCCRGADPLKDQSYVLAMLGQDQLARTLLPGGGDDQGRGPGGGRTDSACARRPSRTARMSASSARTRADRASSAPGCPSIPAGWSTTTPARTSARSRPSSWSPWDSAGAWATDRTVDGASSPPSTCPPDGYGSGRPRRPTPTRCRSTRSPGSDG